MKIEIKHRFNGAVLFEGDFESLKLAVVAAVKGGADLGGANLGDAYLGGADLGGASGIIALGAPAGWHGHAWLRDGFLSIRIGCREFRYAEAMAYWNNHPGGRETRLEQLAATEYARQIALARCWRIE